MLPVAVLRIVVGLCLGVVVTLGAMPAHAGFLDFLHGKTQEAEEPVPDPLPYEVTLEAPDADRKLLKAIEAASGLIDRKDTPPSGFGGLLARARQDVARITGVLYRNARYAGQVRITINGRPLDGIDPFDEVGAVPAAVVIQVDVGAPFVFGTVDIAPLPPETPLEALGVVPGEPARSGLVLQAERDLVDAWRELGHPFARSTQRDTVADHETGTLDVTLRVEPGPSAVIGRVRVEGAVDVDTNLIVGRANLAGRPYALTTVRRAEQRLRDLGVFASVSIGDEDVMDSDGTLPMLITVTERKKRVIGFGASYSSSEGVALETYWRHRNLFGGAERLQLSGSIARLLEDTTDPDYRLAGRFTKPGVIGPLTDVTFGAATYRETNEAYRVTATEADVGLTRIFSDTLTGSLTLGVASAETVDDKGVVETHAPLTLTGKLDWDTTDNRLDPTDGHRIGLLAAPTYDLETDVAYARFSAGGSVYHALDDEKKFVLAARAKASTIMADTLDDVAVDQRLYMGGASSVRGYAYNNIAPRDGDDIVGGLSSVLLSGELRYRVNDQFGAVVFVDAGNAFSSATPDVTDLKVGVGAGVRYFTPVGPIRLDVAVPLQPESGDPSVAIHVGLGQAF